MLLGAAVPVIVLLCTAVHRRGVLLGATMLCAAVCRLALLCAAVRHLMRLCATMHHRVQLRAIPAPPS
eukprot:15431995-Alexandrium_andersonii.AAC.1